MNVKYRVDMDQDERERLTALSRGGRIAARRLKRVQILLAADAGVDDDSMAARRNVSTTLRHRKLEFRLGQPRFSEAG